MSKRTLQEYEDSCQEIRHNPDGSVTFIFDEPASIFLTLVGQPKPVSSTTISKEDYARASADPNLQV